MLTLVTSRLELRSLNECDGRGPYLTWMNDIAVTEFLEARFRSYCEADLRKFIIDINRKSDTIFLGIFTRDTNRHIGNIKLEISPHHRRGEIGLVVGAKSEWGKGYATEAIQRLIDYSFGELQLHKLTAGCYSNNYGSRKAFEKAGFVFDGLRREHYWFENQWVDLIMLVRFSTDSG